MAFGLVMAIAMMAFAANAIAPLLRRWRWLNYGGLALIAFVATKMIVDGAGLSHDLTAALLP
jgi:predicted tellurium resistance membrane protein TerC